MFTLFQSTSIIRPLSMTEQFHPSTYPESATDHQEEISRPPPKDTLCDRFHQRCGLQSSFVFVVFFLLLCSPVFNDMIWHSVDHPFDVFMFFTGNGYIANPQPVYIMGNIIIWMLIIYSCCYFLWQWFFNGRAQVLLVVCWFMAACFLINSLTLLNEPPAILHYTYVVPLELTSLGTMVIPPKPSIVLYAMFDCWDGSRLRRVLISILSVIMVLYLSATAQMYSTSFIFSVSLITVIHYRFQLQNAGKLMSEWARLQPELMGKFQVGELLNLVHLPIRGDVEIGFADPIPNEDFDDLVYQTQHQVKVKGEVVKPPAPKPVVFQIRDEKTASDDEEEHDLLKDDEKQLDGVTLDSLKMIGENFNHVTG